VRQVGYLQELNRDARSTKHKMVYSWPYWTKDSALSRFHIHTQTRTR